MKYNAPEYEDNCSSGDSHGSGNRPKTTGDCPSQLSDERTELLELQWRDGCPVEQPVLSSGEDTAGDTSSPEGEKPKAGGGGPKDHATGGEVIDEWWKLWREGENGGSAAAAAHGYPQIIDDLSSVNAKVATAASVGSPKQQTRTADELWMLWREGHGSSATQDFSCKNSVSKGEGSMLPSSAASRGGGGAQRHSSEQIDHECSTLDHAIEYMKSLQQQIQVLSSSGYGMQPHSTCHGMQPLLFPCVCGQQPPRPAVIPGAAPASALCPALTQPAPPAPPAAPAPMYQSVPLPRPAAAAAESDLNPDMVAVGGAPGGVPGLTGIIATGLGEEMDWNTSEMPFGGCARCSFRRRAGDC